MLKTVNEVNNDKTKMPHEFIFHSVSLVCFTAELDEQIDSQLGLLLKLRLHTLCFSPLFCSPRYSPLKIILKQLVVMAIVS